MEVFGTATAGKAVLVALSWSFGAYVLWRALKLSPEDQRKMRRSGNTLLIRLASFLPGLVLRWFYILLGVGLLVMPLLAVAGVIPWE